jgi:hypothetical protein
MDPKGAQSAYLPEMPPGVDPILTLPTEEYSQMGISRTPTTGLVDSPAQMGIGEATDSSVPKGQ